MAESLHHAHIFASDINSTIAWWTEMLGGEVVHDGPFPDARNVFMRIGEGGLHIYDQDPPEHTTSSVHHLGIRSDDLPALVEQMTQKGMVFRTGIREFGTWRYIMCTAPDNVLLELFSCDPDFEPPEIAEYLRHG